MRANAGMETQRPSIRMSGGKGISRTPWTVLVTTFLLALASALAMTYPTAIPALATVAPLLGLILLRPVLRVGIMSPTVIVVSLLALIGFTGYLLADRLGGLEGGGIQLTLSQELKSQTAYVFAITASLILVGASTILSISRSKTKARLTSFAVSQRSAPWLLIASVLPMLLVLGSLGSEFMQRDRYLAGEGGSNFFGLGQQLGIASIVVAGNVAGSRRGFTRFAAVLLAIAFGILFLGLGSRRLALMPIAFALGLVFARPDKAIRPLVVAGAAAAILLPLPLYLRGLTTHGLIPYAQSISGYRLADVNWAETVNNVLIAFPIAGASATALDQLPLSNLLISVNPLPGSLAGWYDISRTMNLNPWTPYSAVGETANYGLPWSALVWLVVGAVLGWLELRMAHFERNGVPIFSIAIVGLSALFAIQMIQYSLRSSTRMLVYAVAISVAASVWVSLRSKNNLMTAAGAVGKKSQKAPSRQDARTLTSSPLHGNDASTAASQFAE
jgi:hypothetical protein